MIVVTVDNWFFCCCGINGKEQWAININDKLLQSKHFSSWRNNISYVGLVHSQCILQSTVSKTRSAMMIDSWTFDLSMRSHTHRQTPQLQCCRRDPAEPRAEATSERRWRTLRSPHHWHRTSLQSTQRWWRKTARCLAGLSPLEQPWPNNLAHWWDQERHT